MSDRARMEDPELQATFDAGYERGRAAERQAIIITIKTQASNYAATGSVIRADVLDRLAEMIGDDNVD